MKISKNILALSLCFIPVLSGCEGISITPTTDGGLLIKAEKANPPQIESFDFYPKSTYKKDDVITFTVKAKSKNYDEVNYVWKSSKGTLLTNSGKTVSWKPERSDGSMETGIANITVTVTDGVNSTDAGANVFIYSDGSVKSNDITPIYPSVTPLPTPTSTLTPISIPTPTPTATPTTYINSSIYDENCPIDNKYPVAPYQTFRPKPKPTPIPTPTPIKNYSTNNAKYKNIIFSEDFENENNEDLWSINYKETSSDNYLFWKTQKDDTRKNNNVMNLTGPTDDVLIGTCESEVQLVSRAIDLRNVNFPRISFQAKSESNPAESVKLNLYWAVEGRQPRSMNVSLISDKIWSEADIDMRNIIKEEGRGIGRLIIGAKICNNRNTFKGPMIDNIKIYDADE